MKNEWDQIDDFFATLPALFRTVAAAAAEPAAEFLEQHTRATTLYEDLTGATRASTVFYVAGGGEGRVDQMGAMAQQLYDTALGQGLVDKPAIAMIEDVPAEGGEDSITIVGTALMDYDADLVTMQGGARDFMSAALGDAGGAVLIWASGIREFFA